MNLTDVNTDNGWQWDRLCGRGISNFTVWDGKDFGHCFEQLVILSLTHAIHAITSSYHFGRHQHRRIRGEIPHIIVLHLRLFFSLLLVALPFLMLALTYLYLELHPSLADIITWCIRGISWLIHSGLVYRLKRLYHIHVRGPKETIFSFLLTTASVLIQLRTVILHMMHETSYTNLVEESITIATNVIHLCYLLTLIPSKRPELQRSGLDIQDDLSDRSLLEESLHSVANRSYGSIQSRSESHDLGIGEKGNILSKLVFWWAQPLMQKGAKKMIKGPDDLFELPNRLTTEVIEKKFVNVYLQPNRNEDEESEISADYASQFSDTDNMPNNGHQNTHPDTLPVEIVQPNNSRTNQNSKNKMTLLRALNKTFGFEYYSLGILKFFGDNLTFAGPLLLNLLVNYMEDPNEPFWHGYIYALGLFLCTFLSSMFSTHFNYLIQMVALKIRAAIITTVYRKTVSVNSVALGKFSTGEVVNFMSTDTDRITNFCPSFHAVWSLPIQVAIALYLLYVQVGLAFIAGVAFAIILVPVNKWLANKIGQLSTDMMLHKDHRVKVMNEILYGIRVIKFYAWEKHFSSKIHKLRELEVKALKGRKYLDAWCVYFWATTPVLISILTFTTYALLGHQLTAAKVFTSMALFNILLVPLNAFPWVLNGLMESWVSLKRLQRFMELEEQDFKSYYSQHSGQGESVIRIADGTFTWKRNGDDDTRTINDNESEAAEDSETTTRTLHLTSINLDIKKGELVGVIGTVGSGKSSLLSAIMAEMRLQEGGVSVANLHEGFGYASQEAWIQHATVRDNILFGKQYERRLYDAVIEGCALTDDLQILGAGDQTEIGENGVTLSGGQKARVALARAVYQDKSVYLLDDPLAAVDAHVAQHLFDECIMGLLKGKTRILCTHHTKFLHAADKVVVMENGNIIKCGPPGEVLPSVDDLQHSPSRKDSDAGDGEAGEGEQAGKGGELVQEEEKDEGVIKGKVYLAYWRAVGSCLALMVLISMFLMQASRNVTDWWLSYWVTHSHTIHHNNTLHQTMMQHVLYGTLLPSPWMNITDTAEDNIKFYLTVYGSLAAGNSLFTLARAFLFAYGGICAASVIHDQLLKSILQAPISFFDATPIGRIINRFSSDTYATDDSLPFVMNIFFAALYGVLGTLVITCYGLPWFLLVLIPLAILYYFIQHYYRFTSREIKRITSVTLSPIYAHFSETVSGLTTIRATRQKRRFKEENKLRLDENQKAQFAGQVAGQWLGIRLQLIGVAMVTAVAFIAVLEHKFQAVNQGLLGLALSYALSVTGQLNNLLTNFTETEKQMVSVERADQYITQVPQEKTWASLMTPPIWPMKGVISFNRAVLQYRSNLPNALDGVSFETEPGEKIGIVGRTGSGKSSLFLTLFRMVDLQSGYVAIDGFDVALLPLKDVRSRLAIIPQDPFLFSGTVRDNLDPTGQHSDTELWSALQKCHLVQVVERLGGLEADVDERGRCFSVGQKQLVCLARAIITKAKILCIDEATASVDIETDTLIQQTIRQEFSNSTVLTIAHRINTVLDSSRVLVMAHGKVAEFESPRTLLQNNNSIFYSLVHGQH